ncbi:MAG: hypothetical protein ACREOF_02315 [Gemmatimonadales bacterium]
MPTRPRSVSLRAPALAAAVLVLACSQPKDRVPLATMEQGRTYTNWLYGQEYGRLWERLTPEMQRVFGSANALGQFAGKAVTRLGQERQTVDEAVAGAPAERVYSRTSSFAAAPRPMVIQWTMTENGAVSGLVVRPADSSSSE